MVMLAAPERRPVLVVEDDRDTRDLLREALEIEGYDVATARDGAEGLEELRRLRPGLVLLDLFMPVMDGAEFCRRQQEDPAVASIPVVVVSAASGLTARVSALGLAGIMQKPLDLGALFDVVARHCG